MFELLKDPTTINTILIIAALFIFDHIRDRRRGREEEEIGLIDGATIIQAMMIAEGKCRPLSN